ncbi:MULTISPECIES: hypothetical protein [unclassified Prochlorococcus]|uniref:hypothetical protein n=1 Tax=unclassified Prochlorococcus TaxID=2627481 RepID=UPI000533B4CC|nr:MULTISPECIES: hypothetical protein [unclassified Prochlorococcus]KGG27758.1 hypothetical protein EV13_1875 [Prochlorococcus sp. MIT 0702]KGG29635.1 hypothetical protein EV12_0044 [Prochlorococcus sp. MIT 0701]KGG34364.1 hypothetical protein EV14_1260 [Prochlorococcus sp. MIT 0703]
MLISAAVKHHHDHYVCAIGYHYGGDGVCRHNGVYIREDGMSVVWNTDLNPEELLSCLMER